MKLPRIWMSRAVCISGIEIAVKEGKVRIRNFWEKGANYDDEGIREIICR